MSRSCHRNDFEGQPIGCSCEKCFTDKAAKAISSAKYSVVELEVLASVHDEYGEWGTEHEEVVSVKLTKKDMKVVGELLRIKELVSKAPDVWNESVEEAGKSN